MPATSEFVSDKARPADFCPNRPNRSALDYDTDQALRRALRQATLDNSGHSINSGPPCMPKRQISRGTGIDEMLDEEEERFKKLSMKTKGSPPHPVRKVSDTGPCTAALDALEEDINSFFNDNETAGTSSSSSSSGSAWSDDLNDSSMVLDSRFDWVLGEHDVDNSFVQTIEDEFHRLKNLKSYNVLENKHEDKHFDRVTGLCCRIFGVPISLVSLIDMGRQWFFSNQGLEGVDETARNISFCGHAVQSKLDVFEVRDAAKHPYFKNNPLVTGEPYIRFYAGARLVSPEGYALGTLCIIDQDPKPEGLTEDERKSLIDLAAIVVDGMVHRRQNHHAAISNKEGAPKTPATHTRKGSVDMVMNAFCPLQAMARSAVPKAVTPRSSR